MVIVWALHVCLYVFHMILYIIIFEISTSEANWKGGGGANQCLYCVHLRGGGTVSFGEDEHARARNFIVIVKAKI